jgi:hypothetical protein
MSLLQTETGLIILLCSAVLFGTAVLGTVSLMRTRESRSSHAAEVIFRAAAKAPTDAHMALIIAWKMLRHFVRGRSR